MGCELLLQYCELTLDIAAGVIHVSLHIYMLTKQLLSTARYTNK